MLPSPELVARIRSATGDTQEGLARRLGVSFPTVNAWERGRREPRTPHRHELEKLAATLGIHHELAVLAIDDDPTTAELVRAAAMTVDGAVAVHMARDGWDGLIACKSLRPSVLFLDIMMPGIDGLEVAHRLPMLGLDDLAVVFVTASQNPDVLARASALGNGVLTKPLDLEDLSTFMSEGLSSGTRRRIHIGPDPSDLPEGQ